MYIQENIWVTLHSTVHNNGLLLTVINYILKQYSLLTYSNYDSESTVRYLRKWPRFFQSFVYLGGDRLKPQCCKTLSAFPKLFLRTHALKSPCLGDKRTTVVRRDAQRIAQVYPGKPRALMHTQCRVSTFRPHWYGHRWECELLQAFPRANQNMENKGLSKLRADRGPYSIVNVTFFS